MAIVRASRRHTSVPRSVEISEARANRKSPAQDGDGVVPPGVRAGRATARVGLVDHVVVVERGQVHELDRHGPGHEARVGGVAEVARQQHQHRPEPLAARGDQVGGGLRQQAGGLHVDGLLQGDLDLVEAGPHLGLQGGVGRLEARDHTAAHSTTPLPAPGSHDRLSPSQHRRLLDDPGDQPGEDPERQGQGRGDRRAPTRGMSDVSSSWSPAGSRIYMYTITRR